MAAQGNKYKINTMENTELENYISVSEAAKYYGKTTQHIYNMIRDKAIHAVQFNRGTMVGWLVEKPADYDNWLKDYGK